MPGKARPSVCENILKEIYCWGCISETKRKAVIELCERNIPKKIPGAKIDNFYKTIVGMCPVCHTRVVRYMDNYCADCGQRLDWSDF